MGPSDSFSGYHPVVNLLYFGLVIGFSMFFMHPVCLAVSLICAVCYHVSLNGGRAFRSQLVFALPVMLMTALVNLLFNHRGVTILAYLPGGNPLTLESVLYGVAAAVMLWAVVTWFGCYSAVMTSDKFLYLFGRAIPAMSLVISMALRFVPKFKSQLHAVSQAQQCVGRSVSEGPLRQRLRNAVTMLSILLTWSLENAIETADSMKSRGYGLPGRTAFSIYRFDARDRAAMVWLVSCGFFILCGWTSGGLAWQFFPAMKANAVTPMTLCFFGAYLTLCLTPLILNGKEALVWRHLSCAR